jgi:hypothetical protein
MLYDTVLLVIDVLPMLEEDMFDPVILKGYEIVAVFPNLLVTVTEIGALIANRFPGTANDKTPEATDAEEKMEPLYVGPEYVNGAPYVSVTKELSEIVPFLEELCVDTLEVEMAAMDGVEAALPYMLDSVMAPEVGKPGAMP